MNDRFGNDGSPSPANHGPVTPPSLGEIYEISARRQRTRYRVIQGALAAVAVAGVGIGLQSRDGQGAVTSEPGSANGGAATTATPTDAPGADRAEVDEPVVLDGPDSCFLAAPVDTFAPWIAEGRDAYFADQIVPVAELEALAEAWQIPFDEVKGLVGLATRNGVALENGSIDEALVDWSDSGYPPDQLAAIAEEWNVTTVSVKVLQFLKDPAIQASLEDCGL